jgi:hypothetical protein
MAAEFTERVGKQVEKHCSYLHRSARQLRTIAKPVQNNFTQIDSPGPEWISELWGLTKERIAC